MSSEATYASTSDQLAVETLKYIILDTDMGTDDLWALIVLLKADKHFGNVKLLAITGTHGNTSMDNVIANAYAVLNAFDRTDIPVYRGAEDPLIGSKMNDEMAFHGINGLCDIDVTPFVNLAAANRQAQKENAVEIIHKLVMEKPYEVSLICIGPLTNLALALKTYADIRTKIKEIFILGGNVHGVGNSSSSAEYNFYVDPEAAHIALATAQCPITIIPWETGNETGFPISKEWRYEIVKDVTCKAIKLLNLAEAQCYQNAATWTPLDAYVPAALLFPDLAVKKTRRIHATVETSGQYTRGQMIVDHLAKKLPNVTIIDELNHEGCKQILRWAATS